MFQIASPGIALMTSDICNIIRCHLIASDDQNPLEEEHADIVDTTVNVDIFILHIFCGI